MYVCVCGKYLQKTEGDSFQGNALLIPIDCEHMIIINSFNQKQLSSCYMPDIILDSRYL